MSEKPKKKKRFYVLRSGENPVFGFTNPNGVTIALRVDNPKAIKLKKTSKGTFLPIDIPNDGVIKLLALTAVKAASLGITPTKTSKSEEISLEDAIKQAKSKKSEEKEEEAIIFD